MSIVDWYLKVIKQYADFNGRARRTEFWMFFLGNSIISVVLSLLGFIPVIGTLFTVISYLWSLAVLIPTLAVGARRLHDTGRSGWWWLIYLIPLIGFIILIIFWAQEGKLGANEYGNNPKE